MHTHRSSSIRPTARGAPAAGPSALRSRMRLSLLLIGCVAYGLARPPVMAGQAAAAIRQPDRAVDVAVGKATLVAHTQPLKQVSISNPEVAEALVVSPTEVLINGKATGTTSLVIWDAQGGRDLYAVEVTVDAAALQRHLKTLFPEEDLQITASGDVFILRGSASDESVARRAVEIAEATGASVVNSLEVPDPPQVLLKVRFAEVNRTAMQELSANVIRVDPNNIRGDDEGFFGTGRNTPPGNLFLDTGEAGPEQTFSDAVNLFLFNEDWNVGAFITALKTNGLFRSLAEPNLLARDGEEASFLAGGEFPFPIVQGSSVNSAITILFKEFGIRLSFTPHITNSGNVDLEVAPEVSTLDFANGLTVSGFQVPTILSRRASTRVELRDGQTFAIAGLLDNSITENSDKIPLLGDIPILGKLFSSKEMRQNRSELLVLVTPHLITPSEAPEAPEVPTGEPETWDWDDHLKGPANMGGK